MNLQVKDPNAEEGAAPTALRKRDDMYESAVDVVVREGRGSVSLLQRALGIGYGRAARLIDYMAEDGIVGEYNGSQAREVVISIAQWEAMRSGEGGAPKPATGVQIAPNLVAHPPSTPQPKEIVKPKPAAAVVRPAAPVPAATPVATPAASTAASRRRSIISRGDGWDEDDNGESDGEGEGDEEEVFNEESTEEEIPEWEGED